MRTVPQLHFLHDDSVETGQHMDKLIAEAVEADRIAESGSPATTSDSKPEE